MATIDTLINNVKDLNIVLAIKDSFIHNRKVLLKYQRNQMLYGFKSDGKRIGRYKNPEYQRKKQAMNPLAKGFVDLKLTGKFQEELFVDVRDEELIFGSADNEPVNFGDGSIGKSDKLEDQYGEDIFGISEENAGLFSDNELAKTANSLIIKQLQK